VIQINCPWCDAPAEMALEALTDQFQCHECLTSVDLDDEVPESLPLAA
jgi:hypothetical protein